MVGSPTSGRGKADWTSLVGYFVNPVVLRADLSGEPTFAEFLLRTRKAVIEAMEHWEYPFPLLVERLQFQRDASRSPLFQAMFIMQQAPGFADEALAAF